MFKKILITASLVLLSVAVCFAGTATKRPFGIKIGEIAAPSTPESGYGHIYFDTSGNFKAVNDAGSTVTLSAGTGDNTLDNAYDQGSAGAGKKINADSGAVEIEVAAASDNGALLLDMDDSTNNPDVLTITNAGSGSDIAAPNFTLANGVLTTTTANITNLNATNHYSTAVVSASTGNVNLAIDAAGSGTITLGGTSTGNIITDNTVKINGAIDIGDAATDTLTITSIIDGNVTLDDGSGASPSLVFTDATDETATFSKADSGYISLTTEAADGFQVVAGSVKIGDGSPGQTINGEDLYVNGLMEVDGAAYLDGNAAVAGTLSVAGAASFTSTVALSENVTFTMAADEYLKLDADTTDMTQTAGAIDIDLDTVTNGVEGINIDVDVGDTQSGSEIITGVLVDLDDDTSSNTSTIRGFAATSSDVTGEADTSVQGFYTSGCDVAFQADNGYVRIGTGATPDVSPGDDDLFVEGTAEIDGDTRIDGLLTLNAGLMQTAEVVTEANVITAAECGTTYFLNSGTEFQSTLPALSTVSAGCSFKFWVSAAPAGASYTIITGDSKENQIYGSINENEVDTGDDGPTQAAGDTVTFVNSVAVKGDYVEFDSDGSSWYISGQSNADGGITITQAD